MISLFAALAMALEMIPGIPMPGAPFLKFDAAEAPVYIITLLLGVLDGSLTMLGVAIAILAFKGDPLGMMYKIVALFSQLLLLRLLRDKPLSRLTSSLGRSVIMTLFDRITIPILYMAYVPTALLAIIFIFNLIEGVINALLALYVLDVIEKSEILCTLGLKDCPQDMEEE